MFFVQATEGTKDFHSSPQASWVTECFPTCASGGGGEGARIVDENNAQNKPASQTLNTGLALIFTN